MPIELPPDYEALKAQVISNQEAHDQCVYEVWWAADSRYPELPLSARLAIGEAVVSDLLREGRVTLVRGEWTGPRHEREAVADEQAALLGWATWVPQPGEPVTWMTDA
jgi:hypothetical protein